jgi:hypothetical protein
MITPGPWSGTSRGSQDRLMNASPTMEDEDRYNNQSSFYRQSRNLTGSPTVSRPLMSAYDSNSRDENRMSAPILDGEDAKAVLGYLTSGPRSPAYAPLPTSIPTPPPQTESPSPYDSSEYSRRPVTLYDGLNQDNESIQNSRQSSTKTTPKALKSKAEFQDQDLNEDLAFQEMASAAALIEAGVQPNREAPRPSVGKKVMTGAEFEKYRKEQELYRSNSNATKSEKSEGSDEEYDEEDEAERSREMAKQRRKQEAKMSVYRQQMMKVTGERNLPSQTPPVAAVTTKLSMTNLAEKEQKSSDDDEEDDEDIPLGILAAHGFPSKERPPSHLPRTSSAPSIRYTSETYPPPPPPPGQAQGQGQSLPVFARNLPKDPYYGASIVNPSVREPMGYGSGRPGSVYGGSQAGGPALPPGGLVGVIAKEERARALRRSSPNSSSFEISNQSVGLPLPPSMMPAPPPMMSPESQVQMQMNQQMTQMMQMQMQWMQQMMAMQGMGVNSMPQMPMMPGMPQMPFPQAGMMPSNGSASQGSTLGVPAGGVRPMSIASHNGMQQNNDWRQSYAPSMNRMSTMPSIPQLPQGYTPSIAPSERSNIGQPSRYRPVSIAPTENRSTRASTMGLNSSQVWEQRGNTRPVTSSGLSDTSKKPAATIKAISKDDEDDDEGWEEMKRKREGKKLLWRSKKQSIGGKETGLDGVFYPAEIP